MKNIILLIALIIGLNYCQQAHSYEIKSLEIGANLLTVHTVDRSKYFSNNLDGNGMLITNPVSYLGINDKHYFISGVDCANSRIFGSFYKFDNNIIIGGYSYNQKDWKKQGLWNTVGDTLGFMPIIGYKHTEKWQITKNVSLTATAIISPLTINALAGLKYNF